MNLHFCITTRAKQHKSLTFNLLLYSQKLWQPTAGFMAIMLQKEI